jgi:diguanylate cyclase (GGDEF)-like protein
MTNGAGTRPAVDPRLNAMTSLDRTVGPGRRRTFEQGLTRRFAGLRSMAAQLRTSEYIVVGGSPRFRAIQRRRTRAATRIGFLVIAAALVFDGVTLSDFQLDQVRVSIALDAGLFWLALVGWWLLPRGLRHHPELAAWVVIAGVSASTVVTGLSVPPLEAQTVGYLLVLPGLVALVLPWSTRAHFRWLLGYSILALAFLALNPSPRFTADERGDLLVVLVIALGSSLAGHVLLQRAQIRSFAQLERIRLLRLRADADRIELERAHHALELTSRTDPLTGANNRRRLEEDLRAVRAHVDRSGMTYGLLMIDLDRFKTINDRRGHLAGDDVLRRVVTAISTSLRADDAIYRYGGEEFVAILAVPAADRLLAAADRVRKVVESLAIEHVDNQPWGIVTISIGATLVGRFNLELTTEQWLERSDRALYAAKAAGRNWVELDKDLAEPDDPVTTSNEVSSQADPSDAPRRRSSD